MTLVWIFGSQEKQSLRTGSNFRCNPWHVDRNPLENENNEEYVDPIVHEENVDRDSEEWKICSRIVPPNNVEISGLENLHIRDFEIHHNWYETML